MERMQVTLHSYLKTKRQTPDMPTWLGFIVDICEVSSRIPALVSCPWKGTITTRYLFNVRENSRVRDCLRGPWLA